MKYLRQFCIILLISFLGELLHILIPLPIPASVYGLVLMLTALCTGILKLTQVRETADFLIEIMPVMFIPAAVGLLESGRPAAHMASRHRRHGPDHDHRHGGNWQGYTVYDPQKPSSENERS